MLPYLALICIPLIFAIYYEFTCETKNINLKSKKNYTVIVFFAIYFVLLAFRDVSIGADTARYVHTFETIDTYDIKEFVYYIDIVDSGYYILNKIIAIFFNDAQWLLIFVAIIVVIPIAKLYYEESKNSLVSIALFMVMPIFQMNFSGLRQAIAISFVMPALYFVKEKKLIKFILIIVTASLFHNSAFIMIAMYPVYHASIKLKHIIALIPIAIILFRFNDQIYMFMVEFLGETYEDRYAFTQETGAYTMLFLFAVFTLYAFVLADDREYSNNEKGMRNLIIIALFLQMFAPVNSIAMRMNYYYIVFIPIIITQATMHLKIRDNRIKWLINVGIYILFTIYYIDKAYSVDSLGIYPYEFFW